MALTEIRKSQLLAGLRDIFSGIPTGLGVQSHLQVVINRLKLISQNSAEFDYQVKMLCALVKKTKEVEAKIAFNGQTLDPKEVENFLKNKVNFKQKDVDLSFADPEAQKANNIQELKKHYEPRLIQITKEQEKLTPRQRELILQEQKREADMLANAKDKQIVRDSKNFKS